MTPTMKPSIEALGTSLREQCQRAALDDEDVRYLVVVLDASSLQADCSANIRKSVALQILAELSRSEHVFVVEPTKGGTP